MITFTYTNHRGEVAERNVVFESLDYITQPGYAYPPGWFLTGLDLDRNARRSFALQNIIIPDGTVNLFTLFRITP